MSIYKWFQLFDQNGYVCKEKSPSWRPASEAQVDTVCAAFVCSARKSIICGAWQLTCHTQHCTQICGKVWNLKDISTNCCNMQLPKTKKFALHLCFWAFLLCRTYCDWHSKPKHVGGIPHVDFGRTVSRWHAVPTRPPHFNKELTGVLNCKLSEKFIGGELLHGHFMHLTFLPFIFYFRGTSRMLWMCHHWLPLFLNLLGG
jgi:hypothetical protein